MARDSRKAFLRALDEVEPRLRQAFEEAVQDMRSAAQTRVLEDIIRRYAEGQVDLAGAMQEAEIALSLRSGFWAPLDRQIDEAFLQGALYQTNLVPKPGSNTAPQLAVRFDARNPRAEAWTRNRAGELIDEIEEDTRELIRATIDEGVRDNRAYRRITLDIIGRQEGNQRKGGLIGLHSSQAEQVRRMRTALTGPDVGKVDGKSVFWIGQDGKLGSNFTRRDKRFDSTILKALKDDKPLAAADVEKVAGRYADGLLQARGQRIARTEANTAASAGRSEAVQQMIDNGQIRPDLITKRWVATVGKYTRDHHLALSGTEVKWGEKFISPETGFPMDRPHDPDAPAVDTVNCRCVQVVEMDFLAMAE